MAVQIDATAPRRFDDLRTARQIAEGFVSVQTAGAREVAKRLEEMAARAGKSATPLLEKAAIEASKPLRDAYKKNVGDVTGNLAKSIKTYRSKNRYPGVGIAVTGPVVTGPVGASLENGSGNHAWLVEFGTGPRKPGTQGRRTYVNVHQMINGKMRKSGTVNDEQFSRMGKGYYFLMGSINEQTRQTRMGSGYPHDFGSDSPGEMHPVTLQAGEFLDPMPAKRPMQRAINDTSSQVLSGLISALQRQVEAL